MKTLVKNFQTLQTKSTKVLSHPAIIYALLTAAGSAILLWRFPNFVLYPNFYAEDGSIFLQNIMDKGFIGALFSPFNGYFITGLYLLCEVAIVLNQLFGGDTLTLARMFTLVAIMFMAAVIALPYLLFRRQFGKVASLAAVAFGMFLPLPQSPHAVIGTIGNQKFTFTYLAFLLILYRLFNWQSLSWRRLIVIDSLLLICAYTNSVTYALLPLLAIPYIATLFKKRKPSLSRLKTILRHRSFISMIALAVLCLPQVIYIVINGIPAMPGYLDTPYQTNRTIEIFGNRTLLFGFTHVVNGQLGDLRVLVLLAVLLATGWFVLKGREWLVFIAGLYAALISSALFVINRPGVSDFFMGYRSSGSGPDQFFFAQTLIMYLPLAVLAFAIIRRLPHHNYRVALSVVFVGLVLAGNVISIFWQGRLWQHAGVYENNNATFIDQALVQCRQQPKKSTYIPVHTYTPWGPSDGFVARFKPDEICGRQLSRYQPTQQDFNLRPDNNTYHTVRNPEAIRQQFTANNDQMDGIKLFISNFDKPYRDSSYQLRLYDANCKQLVRTADIPRQLPDNSYYRASFPGIANSKNKTYCFKLTPQSSPFNDPLAVQLAKPGVYTAGLLRLEGDRTERDLVFTPTYHQVK